MSQAWRVRGFEGKSVLLVHDQPRIHPGYRPGPDADDVDVVHRREHRNRALAAEVPHQTGDARQDASRVEVHDPNRVRNLAQVMPLGAAEDQVNIVSLISDPSGELEHGPLSAAAIHVGGEDRDPTLRLRPETGSDQTSRTTLRSRRHTVRRMA